MTVAHQINLACEARGANPEGTGSPTGAIMRFHHVGMVVRSVNVANELCRERLKDDARLVWEPVPAFQCFCAFSARFPILEFIVPEAESKLVKFFGGKSILHHIAFAVDDIRRPAPFSPDDLIFDEPAPAFQRLLVNFLKPLGGLLVEVVQESPDARALDSPTDPA